VVEGACGGEINTNGSMIHFRHPEVLVAERRASKGDGPITSAASFEGRFAATSG